MINWLRCLLQNLLCFVVIPCYILAPLFLLVCVITDRISMDPAIGLILLAPYIIIPIGAVELLELTIPDNLSEKYLGPSSGGPSGPNYRGGSACYQEAYQRGYLDAWEGTSFRSTTCSDPSCEQDCEQGYSDGQRDCSAAYDNSSNY